MFILNHLQATQPISVRWQFVVWHVVLSALIVGSFWQIQIPALVDYLNHLARMHILYGYADSLALQGNYQLQWNVAPYFAMEAVVSLLLRVTDIYSAGKIFIIISFILTISSVIFVQFILTKKINIFSFFVYPVLYSGNLGWGFVPFVFSIGLMLCIFSFFLMLCNSNYFCKFIFVVVSSTILFFCHLIVFGIFALLIACAVTAETRWFSRDFFRNGLCMAPAFVPALILWSMVPQPPIDTSIIDGWFSVVILSVLAFNANYALGILSLVPVALILYAGWREKFLLIESPVMQRCIFVVGIVSLLIPERLFNVGLVGLRLPYVWLLLLAAGLSLRPGVLSPYKLRLMFGGCAALFLLRHVMIMDALQTCDAKMIEFREATHLLPRGTTLTATYNMKDTDKCGNIHWPEHVNTIAVIERDAFVPNMFVKIFPIRPADRHDDPGYHVIIPPTIENFFPDGEKYAQQPKKMQEWRKNFAYIAYFHFNTIVPIPDTTEIHRGSWFSLLRVNTHPDNAGLPQVPVTLTQPVRHNAGNNVP